MSWFDELSRRLVPDELWVLAEPLIPRFTPRPQGGETTLVDDRAVFTAIVLVLTSGCAWRYLPRPFGVTVPPRIAGSPNGRMPAYGGACIGLCWTNSATKA